MLRPPPEMDGGCSRACKRPPGVTYSLFTNRGRPAVSARCAQDFLCMSDVLGSDERGHLCGQTSLFTSCLSVAPGQTEKIYLFFFSLVWRRLFCLSKGGVGLQHLAVLWLQCRVVQWQQFQIHKCPFITVYFRLSRWSLRQIWRFDLVWFDQEMCQTALERNQDQLPVVHTLHDVQRPGRGARKHGNMKHCGRYQRRRKSMLDFLFDLLLVHLVSLMDKKRYIIVCLRLDHQYYLLWNQAQSLACQHFTRACLAVMLVAQWENKYASLCVSFTQGGEFW